jgi:3-deoxy-D-manno-octulosonic-acid transferase
MPRLLYTLLYTLLMPLFLLRMLWRSRKSPAYRRRWLERFGLFTAPNFSHQHPVIWLHAVSVGETLAAAPLVKTLQARHPHWQWVITTTTPTGSERVKAVFGDGVFHVYAPYDLPLFLTAFLRRINPSLYIVMETELWPNSLHSCRSRNIPTLVANARLSEKSARGYAKLSSLTLSMLENINVMAVQQQADAERFIKLGLSEENLHITGSIKFDLTLDDALRERATKLRALWSLNGSKPIWLAASTHHGEDAIILDAFTEIKKTFPALLLVISPRHPERFNAVAAQCEQQWKTIRYSSGAQVSLDTDIVIGDTMGELLMFYGAVDIAFVGGSLVASGGHNMIEPAAWACPIITGPSSFNFSEVVAVLQKNQAITTANNSQDLVITIGHWLENVEDAHAAGSRAKQVADANRGALKKLCRLIEGSQHES